MSDLVFGKVVAVWGWGGLIQPDQGGQAIKAYKATFRVVNPGPRGPEFAGRHGGFPKVGERMIVMKIDDPKGSEIPKAYRCALESEWLKCANEYALMGVFPSGQVAQFTQGLMAVIGFSDPQVLQDLRDEGFVGAFLRRSNADGSFADVYIEI